MTKSSGLSFDDALKAAVKYCIENGILVDFLDKNSREVRNMLFDEFSLDDAKEVWFEEGLEKGLEKGLALGEARSVKRMLRRGLSLEAIADAMGYSLDEVTAMSRMQLEEKLGC